MPASGKARPKINLYRNISVTFVVFTAVLLLAVFLFFYHQATIVILANNHEIDLSFNAAVKDQPTATELAEKDVVGGKMIVVSGRASGSFDVLSTKTENSELVGRVRLINSGARPQPLVKTTQLQAASGVIVRTSEGVTVPAGGSVVVDVYPADPSTFQEILPGRLTIIKLNPGLQTKIYGQAESKLTSGPREIKVIAESDLNRARQQLSDQLAAEMRQEMNLDDDKEIKVVVKEFKVDKKIGAEADKFTAELFGLVKSLSFNRQQLANLLQRKIDGQNLVGLQVAEVDFSKFSYTIIDDSQPTDVTIKVNYKITAALAADNPLLDKSNFVGQPVAEVKNYLQQSDLIKEVNVFLSPSWDKKLPNQSKKIKIILQ